MNKLSPEEPLAYAYIEDGKIYYEVPIPYKDQPQYYEVSPGVGFADYTWISLKVMRQLCHELHCLATKLQSSGKNVKEVSAALYELLSQYPPLDTSPVLLLLMVSLIPILVEGCYDPRTIWFLNLVHGRECDIQPFVKCAELEPDETMHYNRDYLQTVALLCLQVEDGQMWARRALSIIEDYPGNPAEIYASACHELENSIKLVKKYFRLDFKTVFRETRKGSGEYVQKTVLDHIDDVIRYEIAQIHFQNAECRVCACCHSYFVPVGRSDTIYCNRPNYIKGGRTCSEIGANKAARQRRAKTPTLRIYRQAYTRMYRRMENESLSRSEFAEWDQQAQHKRDQCLGGTISVEEFLRWIDDTSRLRKSVDTQHLLTPLPIEDDEYEFSPMDLSDPYF